MIKYLSVFNKSKALYLAGALFILVGLINLTPILYFHYINNVTAAVSNVKPDEVSAQISAIEKSSHNKSLVTGFPVALSIPGYRQALSMNLSIIPGYYNKKANTWTLSENAAQFATISSQPNNLTGNTFIYGHYRPSVFAYLHLITPGSIATITTNNGYEFRYKFINTYSVQPKDTSVLSYSISPILTLQTCSGTFFQNRQMFIFSFVSYSKVSN